jgi:2'-5' RNA ligase
MSRLVALDVAVLPPPAVAARAVDISASLPAASREFQLDAEHFPHITLIQSFIREDELDVAFERVDETLRGRDALHIRVTGGGRGASSVWLAIERRPELDDLHESLMHALVGVERPGGTAATFFEGDARVGDVLWVTSYRLKSSFAAYTPHITLGHASEAPVVEPFSFTADVVAACHLGRYCTCRRVLREWTLRPR